MDHEVTHRIPKAEPSSTEVRLTAIETKQEEQGALLADIHGALLGPRDGSKPGHAEQLRDQDRRITRLEKLVAWAAGLGTTVLGALLTAWALFANGPRPPSPPGHP